MSNFKIIGLTANSARVYGFNIYLPLYLTMKDRLMLLERYKDGSDWVELKFGTSDVFETKKGKFRCWLINSAAYNKSLSQSGYGSKNLSPFNLFHPDLAMIATFNSQRSVKK